MKFIIVLAYYCRPKLVLNAIQSIREMNYDNYHVVIVDDGSFPSSNQVIMVDDPIVEQAIVHYIPDTPEQKIIQGGSRHGEFINKAILESNADIAIVLCDDDGITPDYFTNLAKWFSENPDQMYCYSHVRYFDPLTESPFGIEKRPWWTNHTHTLNPENTLDSSQVAFRTKCFQVDGIRYPSPQTKNLDAVLFRQLYSKYGPCKFAGFDGQYKAIFDNQLGTRPEQYIGTIDKP